MVLVRLGLAQAVYRSWITWGGLALALTWGCAGGTKLNGVLGLSPDGHRVLLEHQSQLELYDLATEGHPWRVTVERPAGWYGCIVDWSANGAYFVLGEERYPGSESGLYSVWERDSGRRVSPVYAIKGWFVTSAGGLAVSNDGTWFATNRASGALQIFDNRTGKPAVELPGPVDSSPMAFASDSSHFAFRSGLIELRDGAWQTPTKLPGNATSAWVGPRLALATDDSVQIWENGRATQRVPTHGPVELVAGTHVLAIIEAIDVQLAKHDSHLERLRLYDLDQGTQLFAREDLGSELQVVFRGEQLFVRAFRNTFDTYVLELDARSGKTLRQAGFGEWAAGNRGSPSGRYFFPIVLPEARFIELRDSYEVQMGRFKKLELK